MVDVKICGIKSLADYQICQAAGARWVGMVYYPGSTRHLDIRAMTHLTKQIESVANQRVQRVLLSVNQPMDSLQRLVAAARPDFLQLHGCETIDLVSAIKDKLNLPIIKMVPVATSEDIVNCIAWDNIADWLIFDTKAEKGSQPGGTGHCFNWQILSQYEGRTPWMLAGGLNARKVADAIRISGAQAVDVSSGVEVSPGEKDENKIHDFIRAAQSG